jgi:hypothetical protein
MTGPTASATLATLVGITLAGCAHVSEREVPVGHACQRGFAMELAPRVYHCTFQLQGALGTSPVFNKPDNREQANIVRDLMAKDGGACEIVATREMSDPKAELHHDLAFRVVTISCE